MTGIRSLLWLVLIILVLPSCKEEPYNKFERPDWLKGRLYTIIQEQPELTTFAKGIEMIGYDSIIDRSGNFTVFGPSNMAFEAYFANNPRYGSIEEMEGTEELARLIKYHLVQNPWSKDQLRSLDVGGWIDTTALSNNEPRGFKRETLLRDSDVKYGVKRIVENFDEHLIIVDTLKSDWYRRVASDSRKYVPIFFQEYFNIYNLQSSDYEYYFGRTFDGGDEIYYANGKIISDEIIAENGFIYVIDQVVEPIDNAYQLMENDEKDSYTDFIELINNFVEFKYNEQKTEQQPGFNEGLIVDSLFDLSYPDLSVNVNSEKVVPYGYSGYPPYYTITFHYGIAAPDNNALEQFDQKYFQIQNGWGTLEEAPLHIKRMVARSYLTNSPLYAKDIDNGFYNGESDLIQLDQSVIEKRIFCSNSTFLGLNEAISPRAFTSVAGPVYLKRGYSKVMYAIERSKLLTTLKRPNKDYMFFVPSDEATALDSSFYYDPRNRRFTTLYIEGPNDYEEYHLSVDDLRTLLLNHLGERRPKGLATREFIPNLFGNYIVVNNTTGEISGTAPTKDGYQGPDVDPDIPSIVTFDTDNGVTYDINHWFSFEATELGGQLSSNYNRFFKLLQKADLAGVYNLYDNFILESEKYTVLVPSNAALDSAMVDTLSKSDLRKVLRLHFIEGDLIFTDGNMNPGYYKTTLDDAFAPGNIEIRINPGIDIIEIMDKNGTVYAKVIESEGSNKMAARNIGDPDREIRIPQLKAYAVIQEIDKVLLLDELDTN